MTQFESYFQTYWPAAPCFTYCVEYCGYILFLSHRKLPQSISIKCFNPRKMPYKLYDTLKVRPLIRIRLQIIYRRIQKRENTAVVYMCPFSSSLNIEAQKSLILLWK